ncbi:MAG TPA: helix-turn-helix domain-containing protein, partial [Polyangia bacterium]
RALSLRPPTPAHASHAQPDAGMNLQPGLTFTVDVNVPLKIARDRVLDQFELAYLREALALTSGNVTRAADLAGVNRKFIQRAMARLGLRGNDPEGDAAAENSSEVQV